MKNKLLILVLISLMGAISVFDRKQFAKAAENKTLLGSVEMVPTSFYGMWRVTSKIIDTDSPVTFKTQSLDLWNLSRTNNVITLSNPFNGAVADITIDKTENNYIVFKKTGKYGNKILTDTVEIKLEGNTFKGIDVIQLDSYSSDNKNITKTERAKYSIIGEKIAGESIINN